MSFDVGQGPEIEHSELPALEQLTKMGYEYKSKTNLNKERQKTTEVLLYGRLREALKRINPDATKEPCKILKRIFLTGIENSPTKK